MIKKTLSVLLIAICSLTSVAQDKIKGNKLVSLVETKIDAFSKIVLNEKFKIELLQSDEASVEIETDENLHDVIAFTVVDGTLTFNTTSKIQSSKMLKIIVSYTKALKEIDLNNDAEISALNTFKNDSLELKINDKSKAFLNVRNKMFKLVNNNKTSLSLSSNSKFNIDSEFVTLVLSENSKTEALINCTDLKIQMYQSATADIEGDIEDLNLSTINFSEFSGKNLTANTGYISTEDSSQVDAHVLNTLEIEASGSSEINLYGSPKITIDTFTDTTKLIKKEL